MPKPLHATRILTAHFFRRFFDNDTLQVEGDTTTTIVRALAAVAAPGFMIAFFMQTQYPLHPPRSQWGAIEDQYLFVLLSFVVMAAVAIFEWEMLFPDRLDFLILTPLPVRPRHMLVAKAVALTAFIGLFLTATNLLSTLLFPAVSKIAFWRHLLAHSLAVSAAGLFAALLVLALGSTLLCLLGATRFRILSPLLQMLAITALGLLLVFYARLAGSMSILLTQPLGHARWLPPLWFLSLYDVVLYGRTAPPAAHQLAPYALRATLIAAIVVVALYPLAWARMKRMALEGGAGKRRAPAASLTALLHAIIRTPAQRAAFHFIGQTIRRNNRYQVYLALYAGAGLALATACAVTVQVSGRTITPHISSRGLHAVMPLLLFWIIAGLRTAFASPVALSAGWVFRVTGVDKRHCATAARHWTLACALTLSLAIIILAAAAHWPWRALLVQAVTAISLSVLLTDAFFFERAVPFNQPRMPGRNNFPLLLTLYVGVLTPFIFAVVALTLTLEHHLARLISLLLCTALVHAGVRHLQQDPMEVEEEYEGYEGEFQLLNLS